MAIFNSKLFVYQRVIHEYCMYRNGNPWIDWNHEWFIEYCMYRNPINPSMKSLGLDHLEDISHIYIPILMITFTLWTPGESSGSCWRLHQRHQGGDCGAGSCHQERGNWYIWRFPKVGVPPNHPFIDGFSTINHPFWGTPVYFTHTHWNLSHKHWNFHQHKTTFDPQTLRFSQYPWLCILGAYRCG